MTSTLLDAAELAHIRDEAREIAEDAATLVLGGYRSGARARKKGAVDLVTDFDLRSEALIRERITRAFPSHAIVAEEGAPTGSGRLVWYVDPIDGTTNFAHGHPFFAVSIALCVDDRPVVGVVNAPALGIIWEGARGEGARRIERGASTPCRVTGETTLSDALGATGFPYDLRTSEENNFREFERFKRSARALRRCGAAALDLCLVADGTYDFYWEQTLKPWDLFAGVLFVEEAGGEVSGYQGEELKPHEGRVVATNRALHASVLRELSLARAKA